MNRRTQFFIGSAIAVPVVLFAALWKVSAPIRMLRQFSSQMQNRLSSGSKGNMQFHKVEAKTIKFLPDENAYSIYYGVIWQNVKYNFPEEVWTYCRLKEDNGIYTGTCSGRQGPIMPNGESSDVEVSVR